MRNLNWKVNYKGFIYDMEYIESRGNSGYLVKFERYDDRYHLSWVSEQSANIQKCIVELTSDEIRIIREYPDLTFEYIYNDKNGKNCYLIEFAYDASDKSLDDVLDDFYSSSFTHHIRKINSLTDLTCWRYQPRIEHGTNGCVQNPNKVRKLVRAYIAPDKISEWIDENEWDIMREVTKWSTENLKVFTDAKKVKEENTCSDSTSTNNSENTSEKSE